MFLTAPTVPGGQPRRASHERSEPEGSHLRHRIGHDASMRVVVMGVSAAGKSAVGHATAAVLGLDFVDGDDLHPPANVAKMASGQPLSDGDRQPWLDRIGRRLASSTDGIVIACSALKATYRAQIRTQAHQPIRFIHLDVARDALNQRLATRTGHFMPASLLDDQLATLEWPGEEADVTVIDANMPLDDVVNTVPTSLR